MEWCYSRDVRVPENRAIFVRDIFSYTLRAEESSLRSSIIMTKCFDSDKIFRDRITTRAIPDSRKLFLFKACGSYFYLCGLMRSSLFILRSFLLEREKAHGKIKAARIAL